MSEEKFSRLARKVREHILKHDDIAWKWDGQCASDNLVSDLEIFLNELEAEM